MSLTSDDTSLNIAAITPIEEEAKGLADTKADATSPYHADNSGSNPSNAEASDATDESSRTREDGSVEKDAMGLEDVVNRLLENATSSAEANQTPTTDDAQCETSPDVTTGQTASHPVPASENSFVTTTTVSETQTSSELAHSSVSVCKTTVQNSGPVYTGIGRAESSSTIVITSTSCKEPSFNAIITTPTRTIEFTSPLSSPISVHGDIGSQESDADRSFSSLDTSTAMKIFNVVNEPENLIQQRRTNVREVTDEIVNISSEVEEDKANGQTGTSLEGVIPDDSHNTNSSCPTNVNSSAFTSENTQAVCSNKAGEGTIQEVTPHTIDKMTDKEKESITNSNQLMLERNIDEHVDAKVVENETLQVNIAEKDKGNVDRASNPLDVSIETVSSDEAHSFDNDLHSAVSAVPANVSALDTKTSTDKEIHKTTSDNEIHKETRKDSQPQIETSKESELQKEASRDSDLQNITTIDTGPQKDSGLQKDTGKDTEIQANAGKECELQSETCIRSELEKKTDNDSEIQMEISSDSEQQKESNAKGDLQQKSATNTELTKQAGNGNELQKQTGTGHELQKNTDTKSELEKGTGADCQLQKETDTSSEIQKKTSTSGTVQKDTDVDSGTCAKNSHKEKENNYSFDTTVSNNGEDFDGGLKIIEVISLSHINQSSTELNESSKDTHEPPCIPLPDPIQFPLDMSNGSITWKTSHEPKTAPAKAPTNRKQISIKGKRQNFNSLTSKLVENAALKQNRSPEVFVNNAERLEGLNLPLESQGLEVIDFHSTSSDAGLNTSPQSQANSGRASTSSIASVRSLSPVSTAKEKSSRQVNKRKRKDPVKSQKYQGNAEKTPSSKGPETLVNISQMGSALRPIEVDRYQCQYQHKFKTEKDDMASYFSNSLMSFQNARPFMSDPMLNNPRLLRPTLHVIEPENPMHQPRYPTASAGTRLQQMARIGQPALSPFRPPFGQINNRLPYPDMYQQRPPWQSQIPWHPSGPSPDRRPPFPQPISVIPEMANMNMPGINSLNMPMPGPYHRMNRPGMSLPGYQPTLNLDFMNNRLGRPCMPPEYIVRPRPVAGLQTSANHISGMSGSTVSFAKAFQASFPNTVNPNRAHFTVVSQGQSIIRQNMPNTQKSSGMQVVLNQTPFTVNCAIRAPYNGVPVSSPVSILSCLPTTSPVTAAKTISTKPNNVTPSAESIASSLPKPNPTPVHDRSPVQRQESSTPSISLSPAVTEGSGSMVISSDILKLKFPSYKSSVPPADLNLQLSKPVKCLGCGDEFLYSTSLDDHMKRMSMKIEYKCLECKTVVLFYNRCQLFAHAKGHARGAKAYRLNINNAVISVLDEDQLPDASTFKAALTKNPPEIESENEQQNVVDNNSEEQRSEKEAAISATKKPEESSKKAEECSTTKDIGNNTKDTGNNTKDTGIKKGSVEKPIEIPDSPGRPDSPAMEEFSSSATYPADDGSPEALDPGSYKSVKLSNNRTGFKCPECPYQSETIQGIRKHFHEPEKCIFNCMVCKVVVTGVCSKKAHERFHLKWRPFVCPECAEEIKGPLNVFEKHLELHCLHGRRSLLMRCTCCHIVLLFDSNTVCSHYVNHHCTKYLKCSKCPMAFKSEESYTMHKTNTHSDSGSTCITICKCAMCDTVFPSVDAVKSHFRQVHFKNVQTFYAYKCVTCNPQKLFNTLGSYAEHLKACHNTALLKGMCNACGASITSLAEHSKECSFRCLSKDKDKANASKPSATNDVTSKVIIKCTKCNVDFPNADVYERHMKKHRFVDRRKELGEKAQSSLSIKLKKNSSSPDKEAEFAVVSDSETPKSPPSKFIITNELSPPKPDTKKEERGRKRRNSCTSQTPEKSPPKKARLDLKGLKMKNAVLKVRKEFVGQVPTAPVPKPRFSCTECSQRFTTQIELREHLHSQHDERPQFPCHLCGNTYYNASAVFRHIQMVHEGKAADNPFWCWICMDSSVKKSYPNWKQLEKHLISFHKLSKNSIDYSKFNQYGGIAAANETASGNGYGNGGESDEDCRSEVGSLRSTGVEIEDVPVKRLKTNEDSVFNCAKCSFTIDVREKFAQHIKKHKLDGSELQCAECGLCFSVLPALKRHLFMVHKVRDLKKYKEETGVDVEKEEQLALVLRANDLNAITGSPFKSQIPNGIKQPSTQKKDVKKRVRPKESDVTKSNPLVTLQCNVCYKSFEDAPSLRKHALSHGMAFIRSRRSTLSPTNAPKPTAIK